jgi:ABC-type polysaccharide/polyol phosphate export permease
MIKNELKQFFNLSFSLAKSEFKLRNEGSYLGILWYLLNPILLFLLLFIVFSKNLGANIESYDLYLFLGIIMFNFFSITTSESIWGILSHKTIFKSINFPRSSIIFGTVLKHLFSHLFEIIILTGWMLFSGVNIISILYYLPVLLFFILFIFGVSLIISSLLVYFADISNLWDFITKVLWFVTPLFYTIDPNSNASILNQVNPLYYFVTAGRDVVIYNHLPELNIILGIIGFSLIFLLVGIILFKKLEKKFTENL